MFGLLCPIWVSRLFKTDSGLGSCCSGPVLLEVIPIEEVGDEPGHRESTDEFQFRDVCLWAETFVKLVSVFPFLFSRRLECFLLSSPTDASGAPEGRMYGREPCCPQEWVEALFLLKLSKQCPAISPLSFSTPLASSGVGCFWSW